MIDFVFSISKYLIVLVFLIFTYLSFRTMADVPVKEKRGKYSAQVFFNLLFLTISYFTILLNIWTGKVDSVDTIKILTFYGGQVLFCLIFSSLFPRILHIDRGLNNVMCMMLSIGFVIQTRLSYDTSVRQFYIVIAGSIIFVIFVIAFKKMRFLKRITWFYCALGMGLLMLVYALSAISHGAKLSLDIGNIFSFQPLEFVKIIFVFFIAAAFYRSNSFKYVVITAILAAIHVLIQVMCKDLGSALILFIVYISMLYVATRKFRYVFLGAIGFSGAAYASFRLFSHVQVRVNAWLDPWSDIENDGWQIAQSLFAIGTGGWFGSGLFNGNPKSIPYVSQDMVFSAISEEFGAIFAILLILLSLCFTLMIMKIAIRVESLFYKLVSFGLAVCYAFQVFLTIGGGIKFIPLTGVTYPFISNGGSSIIATMILSGIVQSIYIISEKDVRREKQMLADGADLSEFAGYEDYDEEEIYSDDDAESADYYPEENLPEEYLPEDNYPNDYRIRNDRYREYYHNRFNQYPDYDEYDDYDEYNEYDDYVDYDDDNMIEEEKSDVKKIKQIELM